MAEKIQVRPVRLEDFPGLEKLYGSYSANDGVPIFRLCYENSDDTLFWQVALNENGEIVGCCKSLLIHLQEGDAMFGSRLFIRPDYRGQGIAVSFQKAIGNVPEFSNANNEAIEKLGYFKKFTTKLLVCTGNPRLSSFPHFACQAISEFSIELLQDEMDMQKIIAYDRLVFNYNRSKFTRVWCTQSKPGEPYARTLIAKRRSDGAIIGYSTLREDANLFRLTPLYADDPDIAKALLMESVKLYVSGGSQKIVYVLYDAKNRLMVEFSHRFQLKHELSLTRSYTRGLDGKGRPEMIENYVRADLVYCYHYLWPA